MKLFLDIETIPAIGEQVELIRSFWQDSCKKNNSVIKKGVNDFETFYRNTSFQGEFGRILCIGYATDDNTASAFHGEEKSILENFWGLAREASLFVGHNVMDFDLRFIYKRSAIHGVRPSRELSFARYRSDPIFDTMREWEKWGAQGVSLHKLSLALGITSPKEEGIDGSKVYDYYLEGKTDEIVKYCIRDVEATRKVYNRMIYKN